MPLNPEPGKIYLCRYREGVGTSFSPFHWKAYYFKFKAVTPEGVLLLTGGYQHPEACNQTLATYSYMADSIIFLEEVTSVNAWPSSLERAAQLGYPDEDPVNQEVPKVKRRIINAPVA